MHRPNKSDTSPTTSCGTDFILEHLESTYQETIAYLFARLPMYQRVGAAAYKEGLDGILSLCERLGNPQEKLRYVHVAGTNGKGSTSHFLGSVLQEAGFKTGLYTSPHLVDFRERIKINGEPVSKEFVISFTEANKTVFDELKPSFFEMTLAMAFAWFERNQTDIVVLETGMGGRLDSTNIITPLVSVITNIGFDHMKFLGDTLPQIAFEKAGIIKPEIPVIIGETTPETGPVFIQKADNCQSPIFLCEERLNCSHTGGAQFRLQTENKTIELISGLKGSYQEKNIRTVYGAFLQLQKQLPGLEEPHFLQGIQQVIQNTALRGRWEQLAESPALVCDIGHNEHGFKEIVRCIHDFPHKNLVMILGFVNDKDLKPIFDMLPKHAKYIFTQSSNPRSLTADDLAKSAKDFGFEGKAVSDVKSAVKEGLSVAKPKDLIFLGGSTFTVADYLS
jgi:dihydrofolate synthase/folylpolyglutamate synthase